MAKEFGCSRFPLFEATLREAATLFHQQRRLPLNNYEETEFVSSSSNGNGENREERRKKEVEELISKYAKKKENEEVRRCH